jgi:hypothetical protein
MLITLMQAMGMPESEYVAGSTDSHGFGAYTSSGPYNQMWGSRFYQPITEIWHG